MSCTDIRPLLSAYYDGEVTPEERKEVERHLAHCEDCRLVLNEYRAIGGDLRALPVPVPPAGLRRDVWRAIDAQGPGARAIAGALGGGKLVSLPEVKKERSIASALGKMGRSSTAALPAALLIGGMLLVMALLLIRGTQIQPAARLLARSPLSDYSLALQVKFSKQVVPSDAILYTAVRRIDTSRAITLTNVDKSYDPPGQILSVRPQDPWVPGGRYEIYIDAANIGLGAGSQKLGDKPIVLEFSTVANTPTATNTPTNTPVPTRTTPPTSTKEPTAVAQLTALPTQGGPAPGVGTAVSGEPTARAGTPLPTQTSAPATSTVQPSATAVPSHTPTAAATPTVTPGTATRTPVTAGTPVHRGTPTPRVSPTATPPCSVMPVRGFGQLWNDDPAVRARLGCPKVAEVGLTPAAMQWFEGGYMFWRGDTLTIYVFVGAPSDRFGTWFQFADTWRDGDPTPVPDVAPPPGYFAPVRGFGKLWSENEAIRIALGWATEPETSTNGAWQPFRGGDALWTGDRDIWLMYSDGGWERFRDQYVEPVATPVATKPN